MPLEDYKAELEHLPLFYNLNTTSTTAAELLLGIEEILDYIASVDCSAFYTQTGKQP